MNTESLQIVIGIGQILAVAIIPIIVWVLGIKYQDRKAKKEAQLRLFLTLMADRKSNPITKEWVDALNSIDVVFQDNKKVRQAWREYLDSLNEKSPHFDSSNSFRLDLLSETDRDRSFLLSKIFWVTNEPSGNSLQRKLACFNAFQKLRRRFFRGRISETF